MVTNIRVGNMRFGMGNNVKGWEHGNSILGNAIGGVWECVKAREH